MNDAESVFYKLLLRKVSGEITEEEQLRLADLLKAYPEFSEVYETVQWLWHQAEVSSAQRPPERSRRLLELHLSKLREAGVAPVPDDAGNLPPAGAPGRRRRYAIIGAILLLAACLVTVLVYIGQEEASPRQQPNVVMTRPGSRTRLLLPDGTTVWLNASSRITYGNDFLKKERRVQLEGEAYFEVAKDENRPFIINTDVLDIRVLGTAFNLRSYAADGKAEAVLIDGKIEVQVKGRPQERYLLSSYEKLSITRPAAPEKTDSSRQEEPSRALTISTVSFWGKDSTVAEAAWIDNQLIFAGESLSELALRMERWFGADITVKGTRLQHFRVSGSFENETLDEALKAISLIANCRYSLKDHVAVLYDE